MEGVRFVDASAIFHVSADSLARLAGASPDATSNSEEGRIQDVKRQLGILQTKPRPELDRVYNELAAKYLPALTAKFRESADPLSASASLINAVSYTPYFVRFLRTEGGRGLAPLQAQRMASEPGDIESERVGEMCQFLATVLLLQGANEVNGADKKRLVAKLKVWVRRHGDSFAGETSSRCLAILTDDPQMKDMMGMVRRMTTRGAEECGAPGCERRQQAGGSDLMQCSRCKTTVYCGKEHQRQAWSSHKAVCFSPAF